MAVEMFDEQCSLNVIEITFRYPKIEMSKR